MRYSGSLVKKEREEIFRLFSTDEHIGFSQLERKTGLRSNKLAYHLERMRKEGILAKEDDKYLLTVEGQKYLPILSQVTGKSLGVVPVVLVAGVKNNKILIVKRAIRPYKDHWGLPGGKMLHGESFEGAAARIMQEKAGCEITKPVTRAILLEHVLEKEIVKHSFLLLFVTADIAKTGKKRTYINPMKSRLPIIPSDLHLMQHNMKSKAKIPTILLEESPLRMKEFSR